MRGKVFSGRTKSVHTQQFVQTVPFEYQITHMLVQHVYVDLLSSANLLFVLWFLLCRVVMTQND